MEMEATALFRRKSRFLTRDLFFRNQCSRIQRGTCNPAANGCTQRRRPRL